MNVLCQRNIIFSVTDHMVVITTLPNGDITIVLPNRLGCVHFNIAN